MAKTKDEAPVVETPAAPLTAEQQLAAEKFNGGTDVTGAPVVTLPNGTVVTNR